jgi:hypothetical protein
MKSRKNLAVFQNTFGHLQMETYNQPKHQEVPATTHFLMQLAQI